jgi:hypothetical protein
MQHEFFTNFANLREDRQLVMRAAQCFERLSIWRLHCIDGAEVRNAKERNDHGQNAGSSF